MNGRLKSILIWTVMMVAPITSDVEMPMNGISFLSFVKYNDMIFSSDDILVTKLESQHKKHLFVRCQFSRQSS